MSYIDYTDYKTMSEIKLEEPDFDKTIKKAELLLDYMTVQFYRFNQLEADPIEYRALQFKKAVAAQVDYLHTLNAESFNAIANTPQSYSLGRTSITNIDGRRNDDTNSAAALIAEDVYMHLAGTGLLHRGSI